MKRKNIYWTIVFLLVCLFLYSSIAKIFDLDEFSNEISKSPFLHSISDFLAWLVPLVEAGTAVLMFFGKLRAKVLYIYLYMMASFTFYVCLMMKKAFYLPCGCIGLFESLDWKEHLAVNIALTILVVIAILQEPEERNIPKPISRVSQIENNKLSWL